MRSMQLHRRSIQLMVLLGIALLTSGCMGWVEGGSRPGSIHGNTRADVGGTLFPLSGVRLVTSGATNTLAFTNRNGSFTVGRLFEGQHTVRLQALHATYERSVFVTGREQLPWTVKPTGIVPELFYHLSGLKRLYIDDYGYQITDYGTLVRWEKPNIYVFMDVHAAPYGFDARWVDEYWDELRRWETYLSYQLGFMRIDDASRADIVVRWVPPGSLGDHAGVAKQVAFYHNGSLKRVEIEIDVMYGDFPGLWEHELAHAMGVEHVSDSQSVMYPFLSHGQRTTLSPMEVAHVRLMYDIPSGQQLVGGWSGMRQAGAIVFAGDSAAVPHDEGVFPHDDGVFPHEGDVLSFEGNAFSPDSYLFSVEAALVTGQREHVLRLAPDVMQ